MPLGRGLDARPSRAARCPTATWGRWSGRKGGKGPLEGRRATGAGANAVVVKGGAHLADHAAAGRVGEVEVVEVRDEHLRLAGRETSVRCDGGLDVFSPRCGFITCGESVRMYLA